MSEHTKSEGIEQGVMARLKQLRLQMYGQRGLGQFARELGLSPATYRRDADKVHLIPTNKHY